MQSNEDMNENSTVTKLCLPTQHHLHLKLFSGTSWVQIPHGHDDIKMNDNLYGRTQINGVRSFIIEASTVEDL